MKIKQKTEDFLVEEVLNDKIKEKIGKGDYSLFLLKKENIDTLNCIKQISEKLKVPIKKFGYCGLKDKRGITSQYISLLGNISSSLKEKDFSLSYIGKIEVPLNRGDNKGNNFKIKVRDIDKKIILNNIKKIKEKGFINYYDTQRIGKIPFEKSFGYFLIKKDYKNALLSYYIQKSKFSHRFAKKELKKLFKTWPEIPEELYLPWEMMRPLKYLKENKGDYKEAILKIPKARLEIMVAAFQSIVWNKIVELMIGKKLSLDGFLNLPSEKEYENKDIDLIYKSILAEIKKQDFISLEKDLGVKINQGKRRMIVNPKNLEVGFKEDYAVLSFFLPPGSYATMLVKNIIE